MPKRIIKNRSGYLCTFVCLLLLLSFSSLHSYAQAKKNSDTVSIAEKLTAEKKFAKVNALLSRYRKSHPKDFKATFLQAQTELWANNFRRSDKLYKEALALQPDNDELKMSYTSFLLDLGKFDTVAAILAKIEDHQQNAPISNLHAKFFYWQGDYARAAAYINKSLQQDSKNSEANALRDEIALASAPKVSLNTGYMSDNQPYKALNSTIKFEQSYNKYLSLNIAFDDYRFLQSKTSDAQRLTVNDKLFFPKAGLQLNAGAGVVKYAYKSTTDWTANLGITKKITQQVNLELFGERTPYFDTKTSIDTNITATKLAAKLTWSKRYWKAQAAFLSSIYADDNYVNTAYAWVIAPIEISDNAQFHLGYSITHSNAYDSRYSATAPVSEILSHYPDLSITGLYQPYFTPRNLWVNSVIATLRAQLSKKADLAINTDVGYATISNPYLFLTNSNGDVVIKREFTTAFFKPFNATVAVNYHITKTWLLTAKYMYRTNYFYTSNYVGIGIEKSFLKNKTTAPEKLSKSDYLKKVHEIEKKLQALYGCKNEEDLKKEIAKIKKELTDLRDEQKEKKARSEVMPDSDEAGTLDDRYESLNDMLDEINSVDLNDSKDAGNKNEWLVRKVYQLSSVSYTGTQQE